MQGRILQVNVSPTGGVPKRPVAEAKLEPLGLVGDAVAHPRFHGGPNKAVLLICSEALEELKALGYSLFYGALGENLTTVGLDRRQMRLGQRFRVGTAVIELMSLRRPCQTLDVYGDTIQAHLYDKQVKAGDFTSPRWGMGGFYASVKEPGEVREGAIISLVEPVI